MKKKLQLNGFFLLATFFTTDLLAYDVMSDTTKQSIKRERQSSVKFTTRLHSKGIFNYGGRVATNSPAFDINFTYDRKNWGYMLFKAVDLQDRRSSYNFVLSLFYTRVRLGSRVTVMPQVGALLDQTIKFADKGSDAVFINVTTVRLNKNLSLEHCALFSNVLLETNELDWVNRFRVLYSNAHWDVVLGGWHNNNAFDKNSYFSVGASVAYSRMKITDHLLLSAGMSVISLMRTTDEREYPKRTGIAFTVAAILH